jgi:hypothetical protein
LNQKLTFDGKLTVGRKLRVGRQLTVEPKLTVERIWGKPNPSKSAGHAFGTQLTEIEAFCTATRFHPQKPFKQVFD